MTKKKRYFVSLKLNIIKHFFNIDEIPPKRLGCFFTHNIRLGIKKLARGKYASLFVESWSVVMKTKNVL